MMQDRIIDHKHDHHRNHSCQKKRFCIPDRHISRKAVASIIHTGADIFECRISQNISDQCTDERHNDRKCHIMPDQFASGITGCPITPASFAIVLLVVMPNTNAMITMMIYRSMTIIALSLPISSPVKMIA